MIYSVTEHLLPAAAQSIRRKNPNASGAQDGVSRVIAMMDVAASLGMMIGPIAGGALKELLGYKYMSFMWGKSVIHSLECSSLIVIGLLYLVIAVLAVFFLGSAEIYGAMDTEDNS